MQMFVPRSDSRLNSGEYLNIACDILCVCVTRMSVYVRIMCVYSL